MTERNPRIDPQAGDLVRGVVMFRNEQADIIFMPYYRVVIARKSLFAVTGPSPKKTTTYGNVLFEKLATREHFDGSPKNQAPYGHCYLVTLKEWQKLFDGPESTIERVSHEDDDDEIEADQSVCACFITKPCGDCAGSGKIIVDDAAPECRTCEGTGRKREPKCERCVAEGKP